MQWEDHFYEIINAVTLFFLFLNVKLLLKKYKYLKNLLHL